MRKIRISKRHNPAQRRLEPLPLDPRDRDIVRAKQSRPGTVSRQRPRGLRVPDPPAWSG
jgi:hypothetical protein